MAFLAVVRETFAFALRFASAAGFLLVLTAVVVTSTPLEASLWKNLRLGIRFWMYVGDMGLGVAVASFFGCLVSAVACPPLSRGGAGRMGRYVGVNLATVVLSMFIPRVAALW